MPEFTLTGCAPEPLIAYLKALGILRLVANQADPQVRGWWVPEGFRLRSSATGEELLSFLADRYRPTPVLDPWNSDGGFFAEGDETDIGVLRTSQADRLAVYRRAIGIAAERIRRLNIHPRPAKKPEAERLVAQLGEERPGEPVRWLDDVKVELQTALRASWPDESVEWLDAVVALTGGDPGVRSAPLLGSGGNDGRMEFGLNFAARMPDLFDLTSGECRPEARAWLRAALFGGATAGTPAGSVGQFSPGEAGGPNASSGFEGESRVNPWDFVLAIEGTVAFAGAATRRLEASGGESAAFPFTVTTTGAGSGATALADRHSARSEIWLPVWSRPAGWGDLRALLAEGRVTLGRRSARDGLSFARALAGLGVDRGLDAFHRYLFANRSGRSFLAVALGRQPVLRRPEADLVADLDRDKWLDRVRARGNDKKAATRLRRLVARLEEAVFAVVRQPTPGTVQELLAAAGGLQALASVSRSLMEDGFPPLPPLSAGWLRAADDASDEYRLAVAAGGLTAPGMPFWVNTAPVDSAGREWVPGSRRFAWRTGATVRDLTAVVERRLRDAVVAGCEDVPLAGWPGCDLAAFTAFLDGRVEDRRLREWIPALARVERAELSARAAEPVAVPSGAALLKLLFTPTEVLRSAGLLHDELRFRPDPAWVRLLRAGRAEAAVAAAWRSARAAGLPVGPQPPALVGIDGRRLAASFAFPLDFPGLRELWARSWPRRRADSAA